MSDTIAALSSAHGESAVAVVRLSGPGCREIAASCFARESAPEPRRMTRAKYSALGGEVLDDVMFAFFAAPASYTGEDMLEIFCHGNPFIVQTVLEDLFERGARAASHGEFTRRAFENRKLDLSQAEAVSLMIAARSRHSLDAARRQLEGELSRRINSICDSLVAALAHIEAHIDFADEDLPPESYAEPLALLKGAEADARRLLSTCRYGAVVRDGLNVSITGSPNVGKSSLLNALLGRDRAIVSSRAGTTRDFIVERAVIGGYCVNLTDTAGVRESLDEIESEGIRRAISSAEAADIRLLVVDASSGGPPCSGLLASSLDPKNTIVVLNKSDLPVRCDLSSFGGFRKVSVSCLREEGLEDLKAAMLETVESGGITPAFDDILVSARHGELVRVACLAAGRAADGIEAGVPAELCASEIRLALESLGEIVGRGDNEEVLDKIFSTFCIGK